MCIIFLKCKICKIYYPRNIPPIWYISIYVSPFFCFYLLPFKFLPLMTFILRTIHKIFVSFTSKNWKFFSLFLCIFPDFLGQLFKSTFPHFLLKFYLWWILSPEPFIEFLNHLHQKITNFFLYFYVSFQIFKANF